MKKVMKAVKIFFCILLILIFILLMSLYTFIRLQSPGHEQFIIPLSERKVISSLHKYEDEIFYLTKYMKGNEEKEFRWSYFEPEIVSIEGEDIALEGGSELDENITALFNGNFRGITYLGESDIPIIMFERWNAILAIQQGIVYCEGNPLDNSVFSNPYVYNLVLKKTDIENYYYYYYTFDIG